ncbi:MAG: class I SAM-dependent methyltransferase [Rhodospirillales bacterium]|nr:class I SAM-dependent methyltransferase [Rhodospirillales bacterium]
MSGIRRLLFQAATLLGTARGFFIPYRHAAKVRPPEAYPALARRFEAARSTFLGGLDAIAAHRDTLLAFGSGKPPAPRWEQDWFPGLDAAFAYALVRERRPRRIVEIGSGHSTRFLARAVADGNLATRITCIDPDPRAALEGLAVAWHRHRLEETGCALDTLAAGDVLFVDSSHILMPGTDVDHVLGRILPVLPAGALVHFHDIFLPEPYPADWAWRGYNEQNAVAGLLAGSGFDLVWGSAWIARNMQAEIAARGLDAIPMPKGAHAASLWLAKR